MQSDPFEQARPILEILEEQHHQAYFVGGCVRDLLLKRPIGDIDITTSAAPTLVTQLFDKVIPVGMEHGTVIVLHQGVPYEVTTFRMDGTYSDQRRPDSVTFVKEIDKDLERRDFTINALAMDLSGNIVDLFDGRKDLALKQIRTVGNGYKRFKEDALRIIRAVRFSSQLGFHIHPETLANMKEVSSDISTLAVERITKELSKLFAGDYPSTGWKYLKEAGVYNYLPIFKNEPSLVDKIPTSIPSIPSFGTVIALFHLLQPQISVQQWIKSYKCSNEIKAEANAIVRAYAYFNKNGIDSWLLYKLDEKYYQGFSRIVHLFDPNLLKQNELEDRYKELPIQSRSELCVNGTDIITWFPDRKKGPWIEQILVRIEREIVFGKLKNRKNEIKDWIKWNPPAVD